MSKLPFNARGHLSTPAARDVARQKQAEQALDAEKVALEERMAELRAKRLALAHDLPQRSDDRPAE
ncbi:hypothetical protein [Methylobacterium sp. UNC300MFChir4.1]|uniref:hypothetical protein n=1 Tax=Methylobacterium sp. UNC300MFChir4.1 TaxID=1502747 RepID=UPI001113989E|nr:hypothetical protein [Methylobacterium sp. UNC300MFChir4.1]